MNMFPITTSFEWVDVASVEQAVAQLSARSDRGPVVAKAGGMDLLDLLKEGLVRPGRVVNLKTIRGLDEVEYDDRQGLRLGAMVTLTRIESDPQLRQRYPVLTDAVSHAATPQVRNAATIGGNLLQRPRCWYLRSSFFHEDIAPTEPALNPEGENQFHAIFDNKQTAIVHASTPATALLAYGGSVELTGPQGVRTVPLSEFFLPPQMGKPRETVIQDGEVLTRVIVPQQPPGTRAAYHKQTQRESYDWPICDTAVVLRMDGQTVREASIVMGWVAPTPRRATEAERLLAGKAVNEDLARQAAAAAVAGATPLSKNAYKVPILETVVRRTILGAATGGGRA